MTREADEIEPATDVPATPRSLVELFDRTVAAHPAAIAVDVPAPPGGARVRATYDTLRTATLAIAAGLRDALADTKGAHADDAPDTPREAHREDRSDERRIVLVAIPRDRVALYAAQLGAMRATCAPVCIDPSFPDAHVASIVDDARPFAIVAEAVSAARLRSIAPGIPIIDPNEVGEARARTFDDARTPAPGARDLAYVVHTSGTTGAPKGVLIEHRSIVSLVEEDRLLFGLRPGDRVAQCSSPAYDSSVEETWLAFASGATLVPIDDATLRLGPDLVPWLRDERINVFCPPPTLLRSTGCEDPASALPDLRLLYVGGEPLPQDLADLWSRGRLMVNGYGPTECTVTVTRATIRPGVPVSIGTPVAGTTAHVLDESGREITDGRAGELVITGVALARGYLRRPDLTAERFPMHPELGRIYRTGDLAERLPDGTLRSLGRIDAQVKIRGHRVELGAIENALASLDGVRSAGACVHRSSRRARLVAWVVPVDAQRGLAERALLDALRDRLPPAAVPARIITTDALPTTTGGTLDRRALAERPLPAIGGFDGLTSPSPNGAATEGDTLAIVRRAIAEALDVPDTCDPEHDFFLDLGGDSLSATALVLALRARLPDGWVAVRDIYDNPTADALARLLDDADRVPPPSSNEATVDVDAPAAASSARVACTTVIQATWLALEVILGAAVAAALLFDVTPFLLARIGATTLVVVALLLGVLAIPLAIGIAVITTRLAHRALVGRETPLGAHVAWGSTWLRLWCVERIGRRIPWSMLSGTHFEAIALRMLGARVGRSLQTRRGVDLTSPSWDRLTIGDRVSIGRDASVAPAILERGALLVAPVTIGDDVTIETRAGVAPGVTLASGTRVTPLSWVATSPPAGDSGLLDGVPARPAGRTPAPAALDAGDAREPLHQTVHGVALIAARAFVRALPFAIWATPPAILALISGVGGNEVARWLDAPTLDATWMLTLVAWTPLALVLTLLCLALFVRALGRSTPGAHHVRSLESIRADVKIAATERAGAWLSGSLFWPQWLRLAGSRIARGSEVSSLLDPVPDLLTLGSASFLADGIYLGGPRLDRERLELGRTTLGARTFVGNHAVIPGGHEWPDDFFLGVSTIADAERVVPGTGWFGHPPIELPRRDVVEVDRRLTHDPSPIRVLSRVFWESIRVLLPIPGLAIIVAWLVLVGSVQDAATRALVAAPLATLAAAALAVGGTIGLKWTLLGRVRAGRHALWSCWCSRWDFLYVAWGVWARAALDRLAGTLLLAPVLRLFGMRIGRRVVLGSGFAQVVDPDMLRFDDEATVACQFQAHSFEDRVLKIEPLRIGARATAGRMSIAFYGADLGNDAELAPHAVLMKRDAVPPGCRMDGVPGSLDQRPATRAR